MYFDVVDNWCTGKISRKDQVGIDAPQQAYTPRSGQECHHPWGGKFFKYIICSKYELVKLRIKTFHSC